MKFINDQNKIDAVLIYGKDNRFYFSNTITSNGILFVSKEKAYLLVDSRYIEYCKKMAKDCEVILLTNIQKQLKEIIQQCKVKMVAIDISKISVAEFEYIKSIIKPTHLIKDDLLDRYITARRVVKDESELSNIRESQKLLDLGYNYIIENISEGMTEEKIANNLFFFLKNHGAEDASFNFIVISGKNTSNPHGMPSKKEIKRGDLVLMDFGIKLNHYCSDMTRTFVMKQASNEQREIYNLVLTAQENAINQIKEGVSCKDIDEIARKLIKNAGYEKNFKHSLGHGIGLNIHENPQFSPRSCEKLKSNMVVTVEPGIYIEERFGIRIEDTVFVTKDGNENITKSPKSELLVIG